MLDVGPKFPGKKLAILKNGRQLIWWTCSGFIMWKLWLEHCARLESGTNSWMKPFTTVEVGRIIRRVVLFIYIYILYIFIYKHIWDYLFVYVSS